MIDWLAARLRSWNARLVGEDRWLVQKILKASFAVSVFFHRRGIGRDRGELIITNFDRDLKLKLDCSRSMGFAIYWSGFHEFREFLFLHRFLKPEMVVADIGANLGEYTLFAAKRVRAVLAFEPLPGILVKLNENVTLNNFRHVHIQPYGLSDKAGTLSIHAIDAAHEGLSTFYPGNRKIQQSFEVPLRKLDEEFASFHVDRLDFIKLDIEGGELGALRGAEAVIQRYRPVIMVEINAETYTAAGYTVDDVYQFLELRGYTPHELRKGGQLVPSVNRPLLRNIIFIPT